MPDYGWIQGGVAIIVAGVIGGIWRAIAQIRKDTKRTKEQTEPNGGYSLCDAVNRIEACLVTIRKELAFQRCEAILTSDLSKRATFRTDADGSNIDVSRSYGRSLGYLIEDLQGERWRQIIHPDDQDAYMARLKAAIATQGRLESQVRLVKADGSFVRTFVQAEPVVIDGVFHGLAGEWKQVADPAPR